VNTFGSCGVGFGNRMVNWLTGGGRQRPKTTSQSFVAVCPATDIDLKSCARIAPSWDIVPWQTSASAIYNIASAYGRHNGQLLRTPVIWQMAIHTLENTESPKYAKNCAGTRSAWQPTQSIASSNPSINSSTKSPEMQDMHKRMTRSLTRRGRSILMPC